MKNISSVIVEYLERTMLNKGLALYESDEGKYMAMDESFNVRFKFDIEFSDRAFVCHTLIHTDGELQLSHSVNIAWTNGKAIRDFFQYLQEL